MQTPLLLFLATLQLFQINTITCNGDKDLLNITTVLVFGDSSVDTGNNNYLTTFVKANHNPYGQNFPGQVPTGRFSDGKLVPDLLVSTLGIKETIPPFLQPNLSRFELISGVNFASAGAGYDDFTGSIFDVIPLSQQSGYLRQYFEKLVSLVGEEEARIIISRALALISAGTNDFLFNYYTMPIRELQFNISSYQNFVQTRLKSFLQELYSLGLRIMVVTGLPPIGCLPFQRALAREVINGCLQNQNQDSILYNDKLKKLLQNTQKDLQGSRLVYSDIYKPIMKMIDNPQKYGFVETRRGCCGTGIFLEAGPLCTATASMCSNSSKYLFFDSVHPGQEAYQFIFKYSYQTLVQRYLKNSTEEDYHIHDPK
ncbi:GDSL esterase/lipase At1g58430 isoform X2 [Daucus carota subsp. sativus]|uniref:GDSL esterase/lipase At1g58430 isoform X2 n=1 Tax=Daucus carota subsp. sativus TaxID=79200 RepID=UPI0007EF5CCC|nr:PREDICTED: GDSL esterase/lipase At1g58430-like isoform X2 [Daucus carota subsp. sativus]